MTSPKFIPATVGEHRAELLALNVSYVSWVFAEVDNFFDVDCAGIIGMDAPQYVASSLEKICEQTPPEGIFYLVQHEGRFAGMGGLRKLSTEVAEIKRIYVLPECRGARLGASILSQLMADAGRFGYKHLWLESAPFMRSAHQLYEDAGFADRAPYDLAEVPRPFHDRWRFMQRVLPPHV